MLKQTTILRHLSRRLDLLLFFRLSLGSLFRGASGISSSLATLLRFEILPLLSKFLLPLNVLSLLQESISLLLVHILSQSFFSFFALLGKLGLFLFEFFAFDPFSFESLLSLARLGLPAFLLTLGHGRELGLLLGLHLGEPGLFLLELLLLLEDAVFFLPGALLVLKPLSLPLFLFLAPAGFLFLLDALHAGLFLLAEDRQSLLLLDAQRFEPLDLLDAQSLHALSLLPLQLLESEGLLLREVGEALGFLLLDASAGPLLFSLDPGEPLGLLLLEALLASDLLSAQPFLVLALLLLNPHPVLILLPNALESLLLAELDASLALLILLTDLALSVKLCRLLVEPFLFLLGSSFLLGFDRRLHSPVSRFLLDLGALALLLLATFELFLLKHLLSEAQFLFITLRLQELCLLKLALVEFVEFCLHLGFVLLLFPKNASLFLLLGLLASGFLSFILGLVGFVHLG